jgi:Spy/CpxP family protein refolding chaperone
MSRLDDAGEGRKMGKRALQLALALALAGLGLGPVRAANEPAEPAEAAGVAEAASATDAAAAANDADEKDAAALAAQDPGQRRPSVSPLDRRVNLLAKELDLNAAQQAQVKKLLESQREQVARVWNDASIPAARRVVATQAIGDRTADQIRALLTEEQRKKYIQPRQREASVGAPGGDVQAWMNAGKVK